MNRKYGGQGTKKYWYEQGRQSNWKSVVAVGFIAGFWFCALVFWKYGKNLQEWMVGQ